MMIDSVCSYLVPLDIAGTSARIRETPAARCSSPPRSRRRWRSVLAYYIAARTLRLDRWQEP